MPFRVEESIMIQNDVYPRYLRQLKEHLERKE